MASPEKVLIMALVSLIIIHSSAMYALNPNDWNSLSEKYNANINENHEKLQNLDEQSNWIQQAGTTSLVRLNDFWDSIKMSASFIWLFTTSPYKTMNTDNMYGGATELMLLNGISLMAIGLTAIIALNGYLIFVNRKT